MQLAADTTNFSFETILLQQIINKSMIIIKNHNKTFVDEKYNIA